MLRLPAKGENTPPLVLPKPEAPKPESSRKRRERQSAEVFDETFAKKQGPDRTLVRIISAAAITLIVVLLAGLFWPSNQTDPTSEGSATVLPPELADLPGLGPDPEPESVATTILSQALVRNQLEPIIQAFLMATTLEEAASHTRRPTRTLQRMKRFHGDGYYSPGFRQLKWNKPMRRDGEWAMLEVEDQQFRVMPIALIREDGSWKIDWESWAGWSELTLPTLRAEQPTEPVIIRAIVDPVDYYNFSFSDDSRWTSYRITDPERLDSLYAYAPSLGEIDLRLKPNVGERNLRFTLKVHYPENPETDNQLIIDEILAEGWVAPEDTP